MKKKIQYFKIAILIFTILFLTFCSKDDENDFKPGEGIEFYSAQYRFPYSYGINYDSIILDTINLQLNAFIYYNDIIRYDTLNHIIDLSFPYDSISFCNVGVYGQLFVVTLDSDPVYCGFLWSGYSSVPCHWVAMYEPIEELHDLQKNQIKISLGYPNGEHFHGNDPRNNKEIFRRLLKDGKVK